MFKMIIQTDHKYAYNDMTAMPASNVQNCDLIG